MRTLLVTTDDEDFSVLIFKGLSELLTCKERDGNVWFFWHRNIESATWSAHLHLQKKFLPDPTGACDPRV